MSIKYAFVIDTSRCVGCRSCMIGCRMENLVADGNFRIRVLNSDDAYIFDKPEGTYPNLTESWLPVPCQHCTNAPCVEVCPTGASYVDDRGIVLINKEACIGCDSCITACPYGARAHDNRTNTADGCNMCVHLLDQGKKPFCVNLCSGRALFVGDINDPNSEVSQLMAEGEPYFLMPEKGTEPAAYYL